MAGEIKVGDHVRVTYEGEVRTVGRTGGLTVLTESGTRFVYPKVATSVEKIEPPVEVFGPGDVVRERGGDIVRTLGHDGWINHTTGNWYHDPKAMHNFTSDAYERVAVD